MSFTLENKKTEEYLKPDSDESKHVQLSLVPYWFLVFLRVLLTVQPQIGYIHPDEFYQSIEVLNGDIFGVASTRPWEFNTSFPLRSIAMPYVVVGVPLILLRSLAPFIYLWFDIKAITPYTLLMVPRLSCCLLSFIVDYCLYRICCLYGQNYRARLLTLASSYVMLIYGCRTFSNTFEMVLTSLLIYFAADCMARSDKVILQDEFLREKYNAADNIKDRVKFHRLRLSLPWHTFSNVVPIATVTMIGIFNRPTFLAFAFPPVFFWLQRGLGSRFIGLNDFNMRIIAFSICSLPALFILIIVDSIYYGYLTFEEITTNISLQRDLVVTPYNFIKYNINTSNLAEHGLHPRYTHVLVNVPLLYNVLGFSGLFGFLHIIYRGFLKRWSSLPRIQSIIGLMTTSFIIPVAVLSIFPHQEARFLIPCTLSLIFLHSQRIRYVEEQKSIISKQENGYLGYLKNDLKFSYKDGILGLWYLINIILVLFFGFLHQGGVYPLIRHFSQELEGKSRFTMVHVVTSHIYPLPTSLLQLKYGRSAQYSTQNGTRYQKIQDFYTYELGSSDMDIAAKKLDSVLQLAENTWIEKRLKYKVYFVIPSSLTFDFQAAALIHNLTQRQIKTFFPHVSTEALPYVHFISSSRICPSEDYMEACPADLLYTPWSLDLPLKYVLNIAHQFGLTLFSITRK